MSPREGRAAVCGECVPQRVRVERKAYRAEGRWRERAAAQAQACVCVLACAFVARAVFWWRGGQAGVEKSGVCVNQAQP